jgi:hypothetical protein
MSNIRKLYGILFLDKTERLSKLKRILGKLTEEEIMFVSLLVAIRTDSIFTIRKPKSFVDEDKHTLLLFMYHIVTTDDLLLSLKYLPKEEYTVAISILRGNEFPLVEVLEHIEKIYSIKDISIYVRDKVNLPIRQEVTDVSLSYVIKGDSRIWTTYDTLGRGEIPPNLIILNDRYYPYSKSFKDYLLGKSTVFPLELLDIPIKDFTKVEGKYLTSYTLKGVYTKFIDYPTTLCKVTDWLIDKNYEIAGVKYLFNNKEYSLKETTSLGDLDSLVVLVSHTSRNKLITASIMLRKE